MKFSFFHLFKCNLKNLSHWVLDSDRKYQIIVPGYTGSECIPIKLFAPLSYKIVGLAVILLMSGVHPDDK